MSDLGHWEVPFEEVDRPAEEAVLIADLFDACTVRVLAADTPAGPLAVLELTFGNSHLQRSVRLQYVSSAAGIRSFGRVVRDSANSAAKRLENHR